MRGRGWQWAASRPCGLWPRPPLGASLMLPHSLPFSFAPSFLHSLLSFSIRILPCLLLILSFIFFLLTFYFPPLPCPPSFFVLPALSSLPNSSLLLIFLIPPLLRLVLPFSSHQYPGFLSANACCKMSVC